MCVLHFICSFHELALLFLFLWYSFSFVYLAIWNDFPFFLECPLSSIHLWIFKNCDVLSELRLLCRIVFLLKFTLKCCMSIILCFVNSSLFLWLIFFLLLRSFHFPFYFFHTVSFNEYRCFTFHFCLSWILLDRFLKGKLTSAEGLLLLVAQRKGYLVCC